MVRKHRGKTLDFVARFFFSALGEKKRVFWFARLVKAPPHNRGHDGYLSAMVRQPAPQLRYAPENLFRQVGSAA
jgi:hypothetical protein